MGDYCVSTLICAQQDQTIFETIGYRLDSAEPLTIDGENITGGIIMIDEQAASGHYDQLATLKHVPFAAWNAACRGVFGDHLLASDGHDWASAEALYERSYPAVRVNPDGTISSGEINDAYAYWKVYHRALEAIKQRAGGAATGKENQP